MSNVHTHYHLNVKKDMSHADITHDMEMVFSSGDDTIGMCELETAFHHSEFKRCAAKYGYTAVLGGPSGSAKGALGIAVKTSYGKVVYWGITFCAPHLAHVSPDRYILRVQIERYADGDMISVAETHQWSSGWTGSHSLDAIRKAHWYVGMRVVTAVCRYAAAHNLLHIGAGDLNRPPSSFTHGVLPALLNKKGMTTATYAHTDATHGNVIFDYTWVLSKVKKATIAKWSTPAARSDHDGIRTSVQW